MDQNRCIDSRLIAFDNDKKKKVARKRWAILAKALKSPVGSEPSSPTDEFSLRRISSFMLLTTQLIDMPLNARDARIIERTWYKYSILHESQQFYVVIGHRKRTFSAEDLMGFNNTGNICIWPSEETLAFYICCNLNFFTGKTIIELGGGMSCLAGLFAAKYAAPMTVLVTDGNKTSVDNVNAALLCNQFACPINCELFKWTANENCALYDVVLCADCLFFDEARADLIDCLYSCLDTNGIGLIMAPERGTTLSDFILQAELKGFCCKKVMIYSEIVWEKRSKLLIENSDYDDNLHYPILIEVTKYKVSLD